MEGPLRITWAAKGHTQAESLVAVSDQIPAQNTLWDLLGTFRKTMSGQGRSLFGSKLGSVPLLTCHHGLAWSGALAWFRR